MIPGTIWERSCIILYLLSVAYVRGHTYVTCDTSFYCLSRMLGGRYMFLVLLHSIVCRVAYVRGKMYVPCDTSFYFLSRMLEGRYMFLVIPHSIVCRVC
jgi:hypothetical protein